MTRRVAEIQINDFGGGLHSNAAITELEFNEAYDLSNVVVGPKGTYIRSKNGNSAFNSSAMNSGAAVQSLSYFKLNSGTEYLVSVCGNKIFESTSLDGTMNDITGAVTITSGQDDIWTFLTFNNVHIGFGGPSTNPDAPIQYSGAGNAAALSGTPPSAYGAIQANNRVFAFRTAASPSIIQWSILGNPQDWTGTGSGTQTVSTADNDAITAMVPLNNNVIIIFKQNSIHKMNISTLVSGAFPIFSLFDNVGCIGKHAAVVSDGLIYFITPQATMRITDGVTIIDENSLPQLNYTSDIWSGINTSRLEYIQGSKVSGTDYNHILWLITSTSSGTTNDVAIRWDLDNKCWLRDLTGYKANVIAQNQMGVIYTGSYAGKIYKQDVTGVTTEASESSNNVDAYWSSGWSKFGSFDNFKTVDDAYLSFVTQASGNILFSWGYDFNLNSRQQSVNQLAGNYLYDQSNYDVATYGGQTDKITRISPMGNGRVFQYKVRNNDYKMKINSLNLLGNKLAVGAGG